MKTLNNATLVGDLRHASSVVRDFFFGDHSRKIQNEWMDQLETLLETSADRIEAERDAIINFLRSQSRLFESACDMDFVLEKIKNGVPGAPKRGVPSERRIQELRLAAVRAKLANADAEAWETLKTVRSVLQSVIDEATRATANETASRIMQRGATLEARMERVDRIAKEWGLE